MTRFLQLGILLMAAGLAGISLPWSEPARAGACGSTAPYLLVLSLGQDASSTSSTHQTLLQAQALGSRTGAKTVALGGRELVCQQQISFGFVSGGLGCAAVDSCSTQ